MLVCADVRGFGVELRQTRFAGFAQVRLLVAVLLDEFDRALEVLGLGAFLDPLEVEALQGDLACSLANSKHERECVETRLIWT